MALQKNSADNQAQTSKFSALLPVCEWSAHLTVLYLGSASSNCGIQISPLSSLLLHSRFPSTSFTVAYLCKLKAVNSGRVQTVMLNIIFVVFKTLRISLQRFFQKSLKSCSLKLASFLDVKIYSVSM